MAPKIAQKSRSSFGIALRCLLRLSKSYNCDWSTFVTAFKKLFCSQKTACYVQVDSQVSAKKMKPKGFVIMPC